MAVRTKCLAAYQRASAGSATIYTCPSGRTAIVKSFTAYGGSGNDVQMSLVRSGVPFYFDRRTVSADQGVTVPIYLVLEPGDSIHYEIVSGASGGSIWVSGTELDGVAP